MVHFNQYLNLNKYFGESLIHSSFQYYCVIFLYVLAFITIKYFDNPYFVIWVAYSFIPLLDELLTLDVRNPTKSEVKQLENDLRFKLPLYISLFVDWMFSIFILNHAVSHEFSLFKFIGYILISANNSAGNINISHELMHKDNPLDQLLGSLTLSKNLYMHFYIEHVHGHHKNVATPNDPATSRLNQTLYQFFPQTILGSLKSAWNIEKKRLLEVEKTSVWTYKNRMFYYALNNIILPIIVYKIWGFIGMVLFVGMGLGGSLILEVINYLEHYGLQRKEISPGVYEPVKIQHSWNTSHRISNYFLFKLQRHSDHHENGYKPYQILATYDDSPQLPHGYTVLLVLTWFPKLFFSIMNEYVSKYQNGIEIKEELVKKMHSDILKFITKVSIVLLILNILGFIL